MPTFVCIENENASFHVKSNSSLLKLIETISMWAVISSTGYYNESYYE